MRPGGVLSQCTTFTNSAVNVVGAPLLTSVAVCLPTLVKDRWWLHAARDNDSMVSRRACEVVIELQWSVAGRGS